MRDLWERAWKRFTAILEQVADVNARSIAVGLYFTVMLPFAAYSVFFTDPLNKKGAATGNTSAAHGWMERAPIPNDLDSAKRQG